MEIGFFDCQVDGQDNKGHRRVESGQKTINEWDFLSNYTAKFSLTSLPKLFPAHDR